MGTLIAVFMKGAKLLKIFKFFKVAKPLVLFISMSVSAIAYAFLLGPWLSLLFIALLFVHEMGHIAAMKIKRFKTRTPVFIPFLGAAIFAPKFKNRHTEAFVGYGGPLLGTTASVFLFGIWFLMPENSKAADIVLVASYLGTSLNAFNLLPIHPLDGGRITQAVGTWFRYVGLAALAAFSILFRQPVILYIWILVLSDLTIINKRIRAGLAVVCWISMATLMYCGFSDQSTFVDTLDCCITLPFVAVMVYNAFSSVAFEEKDQRPDLTPQKKFKWFTLYSTLLILLMAIIFVQAHLLPRHH